MTVSADIVVPTRGRPSLTLLLAALDGPTDRLPRRVIVVDDRRSRQSLLETSALSPELRERLDVVAADDHGSARARDRGWRVSDAEWVAFLDDDVIPCRGWLTEERDLADLGPDVGGSQGRIAGRERDVHGLDAARWASANIAFRTSALRRLSDFDARVDRDDTDLAARVRAAGYRIADGRRQVVHPEWPASPSTRTRAPRPSADDAYTRAVRGAVAAWHRLAGDLVSAADRLRGAHP